LGRKDRFFINSNEKATSYLKKKWTQKIAAFALAALLLATPTLTTVQADAPTSKAIGEHTELSLPRVTSKDPSHYKRVTVKIGRAKLAMQGLYILGHAYLPLYDLLDAYVETSYGKSGATHRFSAEGLNVTARDGEYYIVANGRYFHMQVPSVVTTDGVLYIPMQNASKALGVKMSFDTAKLTVTLSGSYAPPISGDRFYADDAVYWLSRIISAESRGEPSLGQIAVGNVILNRVRSNQFPNTIWGVIFDKKYGVQFTPVANGTIYSAPSESAVIAAKICLEGYSLNSEALYFYAPYGSTSSWVEQNRPYLFTIKNHRFFK
jgi:N-acetylmuramoyl-L-alanine amidase